MAKTKGDGLVGGVLPKKVWAAIERKHHGYLRMEDIMGLDASIENTFKVPFTEKSWDSARIVLQAAKSARWEIPDWAMAIIRANYESGAAYALESARKEVAELDKEQNLESILNRGDHRVESYLNKAQNFYSELQLPVPNGLVEEIEQIRSASKEKLSVIYERAIPTKVSAARKTLENLSKEAVYSAGGLMSSLMCANAARASLEEAESLSKKEGVSVAGNFEDLKKEVYIMLHGVYRRITAHFNEEAKKAVDAAKIIRKETDISSYLKESDIEFLSFIKEYFPKGMPEGCRPEKATFAAISRQMKRLEKIESEQAVKEFDRRHYIVKR